MIEVKVINGLSIGYIMKYKVDLRYIFNEARLALAL